MILLLIFGLLTPRLIIVILWLFSNYMDRAFESGWIPLLGFVFLPTTTIAYAIGENAFDGWTTGGGIILLIIGLLIDLGAFGGSGRGLGSKKRRTTGGTEVQA
ncbi:MAG: hypothetical protein WD757_08400 [Actinomycetota bacterium]